MRKKERKKEKTSIFGVCVETRGQGFGINRGPYHLAHDCNCDDWNIFPVSYSHNHDPVAKDCTYNSKLAKNKHRHVFLT